MVLQNCDTRVRSVQIYIMTISSLMESNIIEHIYFIRGKKVIFDFDLSSLYAVQTKVLKQAVRRNIKRFPSDFMFELTQEEYQSLRSQIVTLKRGQHSKYLPFAFTEQGVAMLSGILKSDWAIEVNIAIMRAFIQMRRMISNYKILERKINELENKYDKNFSVVFEALKQLIRQESEPRKRIGYKTGKDE